VGDGSIEINKSCEKCGWGGWGTHREGVSIVDKKVEQGVFGGTWGVSRKHQVIWVGKRKGKEKWPAKKQDGKNGPIERGYARSASREGVKRTILGRRHDLRKKGARDRN